MTSTVSILAIPSSGQIGAWGFADPELPPADTAEHLEAVTEIVDPLGNDDRRVGCPGIGVDRRHKRNEASN